MLNHGSVAGIDTGVRSVGPLVFRGAILVRHMSVPTIFDPLTRCKKLLIDIIIDKVGDNEAASLTAHGERAEDIAMGLHGRSASADRMKTPLVLTNGMAHKRCATKIMEEHPDVSTMVLDDPDMMEAIGAALDGMNGG